MDWPRKRKDSMSRTKDYLMTREIYWDDFDCDIQCDEDAALAAYEAMLEAGIIDLSVPVAASTPMYQPDPNDDIPL